MSDLREGLCLIVEDLEKKVARTQQAIRIETDPLDAEGMCGEKDGMNIALDELRELLRKHKE